MATIANARAWWRETFPKSYKPADPPGVTVPEWLVKAAKFASWVAMAVLVYFLWLYTLDVARDRSAALQMSHVGTWVSAEPISFWFPYIVGFAILAFGIPYVAKIAIPTFMSLTWRGNAWPKAWALVIAASVSLVIIAGTITVQGDTIIERDRESAVAVEGVQQEAAVLASRIADKRAELDDMVNNQSVYVRTAASMSPEAYDAFVARRRGDWQYERLVSYRATSVDAQRLRGEIAALRDQQARQTAVASVARRPETEGSSWIGGLLDWIEGARAILLSLVMDIVCLMMPWIALRLEQSRNLQMAAARAAPIDDDHMIQDLRAEAPIAREPMEAPEERMFDAVTGEPLVKRKATWARKGGRKKGKPEQVTLAPEAPQPDDVQAPKGASDDRWAREAVADELTAAEDGEGEPVLDDETAAAILALEGDEAAAPDHGTVADELMDQGSESTRILDDETAMALPDGEGVMLGEADDQAEDEEPAPARPLVAAE